MMRRIWFFCLLFLPVLVFAQKKEIRFEYVALEIPGSEIYIEKVVDSRNDKNGIGSVYKNGIIADSIDLKGGAAKAMYNYLRFNMAHENAKFPVILQIEYLKADEYKAGDYDSVHTILKLAFAIKDADSVKTIYRAESAYHGSNHDRMKGYERTVRTALGDCIRDFINSDVLDAYGENAKTDQQGIASVEPDSSETKKEVIRRSHIITYSYRQGIHAFGSVISLYGYPDKYHNGWIFPWFLRMELLTIDPAYFNQSDYKSATLNYYGPGICGLKKLNDYFWLDLGLQLYAGSEDLVSKKYGSHVYNIFFGLAPSQGISFISKSKTGLYLSLGIYEKVLSSEVYKNDFGVKGEIGIKF